MIFLFQKNHIRSLEKDFNEIEGPARSKYELFKSVCKKFGASIVSSMNLANLPHCDREPLDPENANQTTKIHIAEHFFHFICNLQNDEYQGFIKDSPQKLELKSCYKLIERNFTTSKQLDFCRLVQ